MNGGIGLDGNGCKIYKKSLCNTKWLLLVVCVLSVAIAPSWSTCYHPQPVQNGVVEVMGKPNGGGQFQNQSKANVKCYHGHHYAKPEFRIVTCFNGKWTNTPDGQYIMPICVVDTASDKCETKPEVENGFYEPMDSSSSHMGDSSYLAGTQLQATCLQNFHLNCPLSHHTTRHQCGRIVCEHDGTWSPVDGQLVKFCVSTTTSPFPGEGPSTVHSSNGEHHPRPNSTLKNYLVITLAIICILIVGALTVALLRRPLFCKKRERCEEAPVMMGGTSSASQVQCGPAMDSLPVAMNTGIFLPGAGYDLQDCHFQDVPIVGTTVFK